MSLRVLVVVAHPDDEVLGCGGTARALTDEGHAVRACILSGGVGARTQRPSDDDLKSDTNAAAEVLGMQKPMLGPFPNIQMNVTPHLELVEFVEAAIVEHQAQWILTHHPHDLNDDHRQVSLATQAAARLAQRGSSTPTLDAFLFMEIASSTDWQFGGTTRAFEPNAFFTIGQRGLESKLEALATYRGVMREYPHPRSTEVIRSMAAIRGGQAGTAFSEAFQAVHLRLDGLL